MEWFEQWFGEEYLQLYPHRDAADAEAAVDLVDRIVAVRGRTVLDLACGPGRHAARLATRGARVVGLDLSLALLHRARHVVPPIPLLVRGDMRRLPCRSSRFDLIVNLFTSFGYFADDTQHADAVAEMARVLRPGGTLVMDYLNAGHVRAGLVPNEEVVVGRQRVAVTRRLEQDGQYVVKDMQLVDTGRRFQERVRLFDPDTLEGLMVDAGLVVRHRFGDYHGEPLAPSRPRTILAAERA